MVLIFESGHSPYVTKYQRELPARHSINLIADILRICDSTMTSSQDDLVTAQKDSDSDSEGNANEDIGDKTKKPRKVQLRWTPYRDVLLLRQASNIGVPTYELSVPLQVAATLPFTAKHGEAQKEWTSAIAPLVGSKEFAPGLGWEKARKVYFCNAIVTAN